MPKIKKASAKKNQLDLSKAILLLIAVVVTGLILLLFFTNVISMTRFTQPMITTYEECVMMAGSRVQESYPAVCVTADGDQFVQPLNEVPVEPEVTTAPTLITD